MRSSRQHLSRVALLLAGVLVLVVVAQLLNRGSRGSHAPAAQGHVTPQLVFNADGALLLAPDGSLWAWGGAGNFGNKLQNSFPLPTVTDTPLRVGTNSDWRKAAPSWSATVALKTNGTLWGWGIDPEGLNSPRQPGAVVARRPPETPNQLHPDSDWVDVQAGIAFFLALKSDGSVWAWGENLHGQLGNGSRTGAGLSAPVNADKDWSAISAGSWNSYALKRDGTLWGWGLDPISGRKNDQMIPERLDDSTNWWKLAAGSFHLVALRRDGTLWLRGQNAHSVALNTTTSSSAKLLQIGPDTDWQDVWSGENYFLARKTDGSWWICGQGPATSLQRPLASRPSTKAPRRIAFDAEPWAIACGSGAGGMLTHDGRLWTWGTRLGVPGRYGIMERIALIAQWFARRRGPNAGRIAKSFPEDHSPFPIWELPQAPGVTEARHSRMTNAPLKRD